MSRNAIFVCARNKASKKHLGFARDSFQIQKNLEKKSATSLSCLQLRVQQVARAINAHARGREIVAANVDDGAEEIALGTLHIHHCTKEEKGKSEK
jgi:hypothetical protein